MKSLFLGTAALACAVSMNAQNKAALYDSTQVEALQEIVVKGVRAQKNAPLPSQTSKNKNLTHFQKQVRSYLSYSLRPQALLPGVKTDLAQVPHICEFVVQAIRVSM